MSSPAAQPRRLVRKLLPRPAEMLLRRAYAGAARSRRWWHRGRPYTVEVLPGLAVEVAPEVFDPVLFRSGVVLAEVVQDHVSPGARVLDLGCGTGASGLAAARAGGLVVSSDINPHAVRCAQANAARLGLELSTHHSDLFDGLEGPFDLITFNPPFFRGSPEIGFDQAWRAEDVFERFAAEMPQHLAPSGVALVLHSDHGACDELTTLLRDRGLVMELAARRDYLTETLQVQRWRLPPS